MIMSPQEGRWAPGKVARLMPGLGCASVKLVAYSQVFKAVYSWCQLFLDDFP